jgi:hypothetical protein
MHIVYYTQEIDKNFEDEFLHNRWTFFNKRVAFIHNFWFPATFITDKFWSDPQLQRSHRGDVFRVLFQFITPSLRRRKLWDKFLPNRWTFFNKRVAFVHNFWFPATFINDKFWSDPPLRRSHRNVAPVQSFYYMQFIAPSSRRRKLWGQVSPQPLNFFYRKSAFVHNF